MGLFDLSPEKILSMLGIDQQQVVDLFAKYQAEWEGMQLGARDASIHFNRRLNSLETDIKEIKTMLRHLLDIDNDPPAGQLAIPLNNGHTITHKE